MYQRPGLQCFSGQIIATNLQSPEMVVIIRESCNKFALKSSFGMLVICPGRMKPSRGKTHQETHDQPQSLGNTSE